jgi:hypothetical protein
MWRVLVATLAFGLLNGAPAGFDAASVRVNDSGGPRYGFLQYAGGRLGIEGFRACLWRDAGY